MAQIRDLVAVGRTLSFEFFPPKTDQGLRGLEKTLHELEPLHPSFVSMTYGAGGTTREVTRDLVIDISRNRPFPAMAHLTCVGHSREDLVEMLTDYAANGVYNILALAGDPPLDGSPAGGDFRYASELVELIRSTPGEKKQQIENVALYQASRNGLPHVGAALAAIAPQPGLTFLQSTARDRKNVFAALMEAVKTHSLGQISHALYEVGGEYRRNM